MFVKGAIIDKLYFFELGGVPVKPPAGEYPGLFDCIWMYTCLRMDFVFQPLFRKKTVPLVFAHNCSANVIVDSRPLRR